MDIISKEKRRELLRRIRAYSPTFAEKALDRLLSEQGVDAVENAVRFSETQKGSKNMSTDAVTLRSRAAAVGIDDRKAAGLAQALGVDQGAKALLALIARKEAVEDVKTATKELVASAPQPPAAARDPLLLAFPGLLYGNERPASKQTSAQLERAFPGLYQQPKTKAASTPPDWVQNLFRGRKEDAKIDLLDAIAALHEALGTPSALIDVMGEDMQEQATYDLLKKAVERTGQTVTFNLEAN